MGSVWLCMCGIDSKHFCVSVTHLTGIQLNPSSASRGKKCVPISKDLLLSWLKGLPCYKLKLPANTFSFVPPHLPSSLTPFPLASLSSHTPPISHPSPLTPLPSHIPLLTPLPSHIPLLSHPPISHPSPITPLPSHIPLLTHPSHLTSLPSHTPSFLPNLSRETPIFTNWTSMPKKMHSSSMREQTTQQKST